MGVLDGQVTKLKPHTDVVGVEKIGSTLGLPTQREFEAILEKYGVARRVLLALNEEPEEELPQQTVTLARDLAQRLANSIKSFEHFANANNIPSAVNELTNMPGTTDEILRQIRPQVRGGAATWAQEQMEARELLGAARQTHTEVEELVTATRDLVERVGTGQLASFYSKEAERHSNAALGWLIASIGLLLGLIGVGFWLYAGTPTSGNWQIYATAVGAKVFVVGALTYGLVFTTRAYRNNKHLQAVYRQRSAALDTYTLMAKTLTDEQGRGIVLTKLAEAIFAPSDTGMSTSGGGDKTIVETTIPFMSALQSQQR